MKNLLLFLLLLAIGGAGFDLAAQDSRLELRLFAVSSGASAIFSRHTQGTETFYYDGGGVGARISGDRLSLSYISGNSNLVSATDSSADVSIDMRYSGECKTTQTALEHSWYSDKPQARSQWTFALGAGVMNLDCTNRNLDDGTLLNYSARSSVLTLSLDYIFSGSFFMGMQTTSGIGSAKVHYPDPKSEQRYKSV